MLDCATFSQFEAVLSDARADANMQQVPAHAQAMPLSQVQSGAHIRVVDVLLPGSDGERLMEMGLTSGTQLRLLQRGPGAHVLRIALRGYVLSLSTHAAQGIVVEAA